MKFFKFYSKKYLKKKQVSHDYSGAETDYM